MGIFDFLKRTEKTTVSPDTNAVVGLFDEQAIDVLVKFISRIPDPDEVLKQAGVPRHKLSVLLYDDEIAQAFETRLDALLSVPMRIEPSETPEAPLLREMIEPFVRDALTGIFQARPFGYSVLEAVYLKRDDGRVGLAYLGEKPMEWFEPKKDGSLYYFPNDGSGGGEGIVVDQMFKFFLTRNRPTYKNPYGEALLSRLYWPWYFRTNGWKFWGKFLERFGTPLIVGKSDDPKKMVAALLAAHSNAALGVGRDDSVEAVGVPNNNGGAFEAFEAAAIRRIQKVVLGQTLTSGTDNGSGNRALGQVHESVRMDKRNSDIALVEATMQRVVDALCVVNGWAKHTIHFADGAGLEKDRALRDKDLYAIGVRFSPDYITDNYDLSAEDFTLSGSSTSDPGAAPPQTGGDDGNKDPSIEPSGIQATQRLRAFSKSKFTNKQQMVEDLADQMLAEDVQPLETDLVRKAILAAESPEDLQTRLFALIEDKVSTDEFRSILERALYVGDVLGYVHAEKQ